MADDAQKLLLFVVAPLLAWIFCALYGNGTVADVPVAVVDNDRSALSRTMIRAIDATRLMRVAAEPGSIDALKNGIASGAYAAGFVFPANMQADVKSSRQVHPQLFCNGIGYLTASLVIREAQTVMRTVGAGIVKTRLTRSGIPDAQAMALVSPVAVDLSNLYNPAMNYRDFLTPGLVFAQLGTIVMLAGAICFARERERNTLGRLRLRANAGSFSAMHGKSLPYALCIAAIIGMTVFILFPAYRIGNLSDTLSALPGLFLFLTASWWIGALIGTLAGQVLVAASLSFGIGMPSFLFSGWTFPLPATPQLYTWIAAALPFPHLMQIWFDAAQKGLGPFAAPVDLAALIILTVAAHFSTRILLVFFWNRRLQKKVSDA